MLTRVESRSRMFQKASNSEYQRRMRECRSLKAGVLVWQEEGGSLSCGTADRAIEGTHLADYLVASVLLTAESWTRDPVQLATGRQKECNERTMSAHKALGRRSTSPHSVTILGSSCPCLWHKKEGKLWRAVCSHPPMHASSKALPWAKGDTAAIIVGGGERSEVMATQQPMQERTRMRKSIEQSNIRK